MHMQSISPYENVTEQEYDYMRCEIFGENCFPSRCMKTFCPHLYMHEETYHCEVAIIYCHSHLRPLTDMWSLRNVLEGIFALLFSVLQIKTNTGVLQKIMASSLCLQQAFETYGTPWTGKVEV